MIPLSVLVAVLTAAMAALNIAQPGAIPIYAVAAGAAMTAATWMARGIYVFLRLFVAGYAVAFALFAVGFLVFASGGPPSWAPGWAATLQPRPFLAVAFAAYALVIVAIARLPLIRETVGLSEAYFTSAEPSRLAGLPGRTLSEGAIGRGFLLAIVLINFVQTYLLILFNLWQGALFDSFQNVDAAAFWTLIGLFLLLAGGWIVLAVVEYLFGQYMLIRWRRHMSRQFVAEWLEDERHYRMQFLGEPADNPDQRIAEDLRLYVTSTYSIAMSLFSTLLTLAAFVQLLWGLSERFRVEEGHAFMTSITAIPGFLVWVCLAYAVFATVVGHLIGRALIERNFRKERTEADFRFGLARLREYGEQVALLDGERAERGTLYASYDRQVQATYALVQTTRNLRIFSFSISQLTDVLPYVLVAPAYFAGVGTLGMLQQTANAFSRVQSGFTIFLDLYETLAAYKASVNRITGFRASLAEASAPVPIGRIEAAGPGIVIEDLDLAVPGGRRIGRIDRLELAPGQSVLLGGPSGAGKSTLFRAVAGIWPFGAGRIAAPKGARVMLLPQRPYVPLGTLRAALAYPGPAEAHSDAEIVEAMRAMGLGHLVERLDEAALWPLALSGGEQQRVALVRALLAKPDWLFLDEATASLDEAMEARVLAELRARLPGATIVSIGHRGTLQALHDRRLEMRPNDDGSFTPRDVAAT